MLRQLFDTRPFDRLIPPPVYVADQHGLEQLADSLRSEPMVAVDTEANTLFAYRERLCLLQLSTATQDYLIDPLAGLDLSVLDPLFSSAGITKVFHDAEYDVQLLRRQRWIDIAGIYDTRVTAAALGFSELSLAALVKRYLGLDLDKRHQRSDWGRRPLSDPQLDYARQDTTHLLKLAAFLRSELGSRDELTRLEVAAECRRLETLRPEAKVFQPDQYILLRGAERLDPIGCSVLRQLFVLRHELADRSDQPPFKILANEMLVALAKLRPVDSSSLRSCSAIPDRLADRYESQILNSIRAGIATGPLARPSLARGDPDRLTPGQRAVYESLRAWRKRVSEARHTDPALVLPKPTLLVLARVHPVPLDLAALDRLQILEAWRMAHYGEAILRAMQRP